MQHSATPAFLKRQRNLFWLMTLTLLLASVAIVYKFQGYFTHSFFQILVVVQALWCGGLIWFLQKRFFAWHALTLETQESDLLIARKRDQTRIPYSKIAKLHVQIKDQKIIRMKVEIAGAEKMITLQVGDAEALYETLKLKLENPWKIAVETFVPLTGLNRILWLALPALILVVVVFRGYMAFEAISMRPDLGITYENWLILAFTEFLIGLTLASQVLQRKRAAYGVALVIGSLFLYGILMALQMEGLEQAPRWYAVAFCTYTAILALADLVAALLWFRKPPPPFASHDLGTDTSLFA